MKQFRLTTLLRRTLLLVASIVLLTTGAAAFDTTADSGLLMLVSKTHPVSSDYVPALVKLENINSTSNGMSMRAETAEAFTRMYADMMADGVSSCNVISAYRSYSYQKYLVDSKVEKRVANGSSYEYAYSQVTLSTAPAGSSEHQLGLALDLSTSTQSSQGFASSEAGKWMGEHAWKYGFIRRYQADKSQFTGIVNEAWHFRYVGVPHAQIMVENGWCFEEYIAYLHEHGSYTITTDEATYHIYWTANENAEFEDIIDISRDNDGGWIITTSSAADPLAAVIGHWSEGSFLALKERGVEFFSLINPKRVITVGEFARLCGLEIPENSNETLTREDAAALLEPYLPDKTLTYLTYSDLSKVSGNRFQSLQIAVTNGIFTHAEGTDFRPTDQFTWGEAAATALRYLELMDTVAAEAETEEETNAETETPANDNKNTPPSKRP